MTGTERSTAAKDLALGLYEEVAELARQIGQYKTHILQAPVIERHNVAHDAADVLKYLIALCQLHGLSAAELYSAFLRKSEVVTDRARGERLVLREQTPVVLTDLDDVIADLTDWRAKLALVSEGIDDKLQAAYASEVWKDEFHKRGGLRHLDPVPGAIAALGQLQRQGFKIVIITARPYWQYKRMYPDTVDWLQAHAVPYDLLLFNKDKAEAIHNNVSPARPVFLVEDREKHAKEVAAIGVPVLLFNRPHNQGVMDTDLIRRISSWDDVLVAAKEVLGSESACSVSGL